LIQNMATSLRFGGKRAMVLLQSFKGREPCNCSRLQVRVEDAHVTVIVVLVKLCVLIKFMWYLTWTSK
jgi:hypothetical protein